MMPNQEAAEYLSKLARTRRIIVISELLHDEATPPTVKSWIVHGSMSLRLGHRAFHDKGLRFLNCGLGRIDGNRIIVFHKRNEQFVKRAIEEHTKLKAEYKEIKSMLDEAAKEIRGIGGL